jgi:hypothetical protein
MFKIQSNIILLSTPGSSKWFLPFWSSDQNFVCISHPAEVNGSNYTLLHKWQMSTFWMQLTEGGWLNAWEWVCLYLLGQDYAVSLTGLRCRQWGREMAGKGGPSPIPCRPDRVPVIERVCCAMAWGGGLLHRLPGKVRKVKVPSAGNHRGDCFVCSWLTYASIDTGSRSCLLEPAYVTEHGGPNIGASSFGIPFNMLHRNRKYS